MEELIGAVINSDNFEIIESEIVTERSQKKVYDRLHIESELIIEGQIIFEA